MEEVMMDWVKDACGLATLVGLWGAFAAWGEIISTVVGG